MKLLCVLLISLSTAAFVETVHPAAVVPARPMVPPQRVVPRAPPLVTEVARPVARPMVTEVARPVMAPAFAPPVTLPPIPLHL